MGWNFGDIIEAVEDAIPGDATAFIHGERLISWAEATRTTSPGGVSPRSSEAT